MTWESCLGRLEALTEGLSPNNLTGNFWNGMLTLCLEIGGAERH